MIDRSAISSEQSQAEAGRTALLSNGALARVAHVLRTYTIFILFGVLLVTATLVSDVFMSTRNIANVVRVASILGLVTLGEALVLISGRFDLSVGMTLGAAGTIYLTLEPYGLAVATLGALLIGMLIGAINGALIGILKANAFIVTLGMYSVIFGGILLYTRAEFLTGENPAFTFYGRAEPLGIPMPVLLFLVALVVLEILLRKTPFGRGQMDRPLVGITYNYFVHTEFVASALGSGELLPHMIDIAPVLAEYDRLIAARELIGDDMISVVEPFFGIPWLEAICGCRVMVASGKSIWPEPPENSTEIEDLSWSEDDPWLRKLLELAQTVVRYVTDRCAVSVGHLRGPTDVLIAALGSERFFLSFYDNPQLIERLAGQAASIWLKVAQAQAKILPPYRGGYGVRFYGLWAPAQAACLQDDTSVMISSSHYRRFFLGPIRTMSIFPISMVHLHIPSLHIVEILAELPNMRAVNLTFDSQAITLQRAMPALQRLQARKMPLILTKDAYAGFSLMEYEEILDGLSPRGLCVHLKADSLDEGRAVMSYVRERARLA